MKTPYPADPDKSKRIDSRRFSGAPPTGFGVLDPVGSVLGMLARDPNLDPAQAAHFQQVKDDDLRTFDIPDDDGGSWSESYWRERAL